MQLHAMQASGASKLLLACLENVAPGLACVASIPSGATSAARHSELSACTRERSATYIHIEPYRTLNGFDLEDMSYPKRSTTHTFQGADLRCACASACHASSGERLKVLAA